MSSLGDQLRALAVTADTWRPTDAGPVPTPVPIPVSPPVTVSGSIPVVDLGWSNNRAYITPGRAGVAMRFTTGGKDSASSLPFIAAAEYNGPPAPRLAVLSATPGKFTSDWGPSGSSGPSNSVTVKFALGNGDNFGFYPRLMKNSVYYVNIRDEDDSGGGMFVDLAINSL